mmetsp:Transcript_41957/g.129966  ORF Transcript_41957/g.129966 Transcript_41957/m.129966 type:complete len:323 (+) Transcript_41957:521-1489(+)
MCRGASGTPGGFVRPPCAPAAATRLQFAPTLARRLAPLVDHQRLLQPLDACDQLREGLLRRVGEDELPRVLLGDHAVVDEGLPVDARVPELLADEDHRQRALDLARLHEREELEELVAGAEAAGRDDKPHALVGHPELAREEIVVLEAQGGRDVRVQAILEGQGNAKSHGLAAGKRGAVVRSRHHAGPAPRADVVLGLPLLGPLHGPLRHHPREVADGVEHGDEEGLLPQPLERGLRLAVAGAGHGGRLGLLQRRLVLRPRLRPRGAEEHDDVLHALRVEARLGLLQLAQDADEARLAGVQEAGVGIGLLRLRPDQGLGLRR